MNTIKTLLFTAAALSVPLWAENITLTPKAIPGAVKADANIPSAGYGSSTVQTQLRVDVKDSEQAIRFVRTNTDPLVITKLYTLKHAEPYAMRGYLLSVVQGTKVRGNPVEVDAVKAGSLRMHFAFREGQELLAMYSSSRPCRVFCMFSTVSSTVRPSDSIAEEPSMIP